jgi:hypothetical protein
MGAMIVHAYGAPPSIAAPILFDPRRRGVERFAREKTPPSWRIISVLSFRQLRCFRSEKKRRFTEMTNEHF